MRYTGRVAVVTGAASGIGRATALRLAMSGCSVVGVDIDPIGLEESLRLLPGGSHACHTVDVSDATAVAQGMTTVGEKFGRLDYVVNCAASFVAAGPSVSTWQWDHILSVNVRGVSNVVQAAIPLLRATEGAAVVNVSSVSAHIAQSNRWTYNATKAAIVALTKCMAMDLAIDRIRVNVVSPGWIWTPEVARAADGDRERWEPVWGQYHMLRRLGEPSEVANVIAFLLSDDASFVTGSEYPVDGGYLAMGPEGLGETSKFSGSR